MFASGDLVSWLREAAKKIILLLMAEKIYFDFVC